MKVALRVGFEVNDKIAFKDFEYKGEKPFKDILPSKAFPNEDPGLILFSVSRN